MEKQRLSYIDITKLICVLLIAISHTNLLNPIVNNAFNGFYIVVFFICTGITFNIDRVKQKGYLLKYVTKLLKYYLFYSIVLVLMNSILSIVTGTFSSEMLTNNIIGIFYSRYFMFRGSSTILLGSGNAPMWFLTCFIATYIIWFLCNYIIQKYNIKSGYIIIAVAGIIIAWLLSHFDVLLPWSLDTVPYMLAFVSIGYILKQMDIDKKDYKWLIIIAIILYAFMAYYSNGINLSIKNYGNSFIHTTLMGIVGSCLVIMISYYISVIFLKINNKVVTSVYNYLLKASKCTMDIMCYHLMIIFVLGKIIHNPILLIIIITITIVVSSPIVNFVVKKIIRVK